MKIQDIESYIKETYRSSIRPNEIYYWEQQGLFEVKRNKSDRRDYKVDDIYKTVIAIWLLRQLGIKVRTIKKALVEENVIAIEEIKQKIDIIENKIIRDTKQYFSN